MKNNYLLVLFVITIGLSFGCKKDEKIDEEPAILEYIKEHNLIAEKTSEGIYYVIQREGEGKSPTINNEVVIDYKGTLLNGDKFDSSYDRGTPLTGRLTQFIVGWQIGIPLFKEGGKGKLIIPSEYGYGSRGSGSIPGNSTLVFDIELYKVK